MTAGPSLAHRIRAAREAAGLNQSELGRLLGVTPQAVQHWEKGGGILHRRVVEVAAALHVTPESLLFGNAEPDPDLHAAVFALLERVDLLEHRLDLLTGRRPERRRGDRRDS